MPATDIDVDIDADDPAVHWLICPRCNGATRPADLRIQSIRRGGVEIARRFRCSVCGHSRPKHEWTVCSATGPIAVI